MKDEVFYKGMAKLGAAYPDYECSASTVEVYRDMLQRLSDLEFEAAVNHHILTHKWFPKISELAVAAQVSLPTPIEVWNSLITAAERNQYQKPEMDAATERALRAVGGWERFTMTYSDELKWLFKEFKEVYLAAREQDAGGRPELGQPPPQLEGPERAIVPNQRAGASSIDKP